MQKNFGSLFRPRKSNVAWPQVISNNPRPSDCSAGSCSEIISGMKTETLDTVVCCLS